MPGGTSTPATRFQARLRAILRGIQIDPGKRKRDSGRAPERAIAESFVDAIAAGLEEAFAKAAPDQEITVSALVSQDRVNLMARKYVTSFTTYIEDGELYVLLYHVNWRTIRLKRGDPLPIPWPEDEKMDFRVVAKGHFAHKVTDS